MLIASGLGAVVEGRHHRLGTLTQMEAGYFPIILGVLLAGLGLVIGLQAVLRETGPHHRPGAGEAFVPPDWRGVLCIVAGVIAFILAGGAFGLAPAVFLCALISAFGDRTATLRGVIVLAVSLTVFAVLLFSVLLKIQFPVLHWPE